MSDVSEFQVCEGAIENVRCANLVRVLTADGCGRPQRLNGNSWMKLLQRCLEAVDAHVAS